MPAVSIIVPCYNEQSTIFLLLESIYGQTYPRSDLEVLIADGMSVDATRQEIQRFQECYPDLTVKIIDNPRRNIPSALNLSIKAAQGDFIVRLDAHSTPSPEYVARCISALQEGKGDNVGGIWDIRAGGPSWISQAIAVAAAHPIGAGDAGYRVGGASRAVDTVPFGAFRRSLVERIGGFDETLLTNEDYEFNTRIRKSGGTIWLDPEIRAVYFARPDLPSLARQYWRYGYWKARMLKRYPETLRWRQFLPPAFVLSLLVLALAALFLLAARWLLGVELLVYLLVLLVVGAQEARKRRDAWLAPGLVLAVMTMHVCWGTALLWGLVARGT